MNFTRIEYPIFLAVVLVLAWGCRRRITHHAILLAASYYFYAHWDWRFLGLLIVSTLCDYCIAGRIGGIGFQPVMGTEPETGWKPIPLAKVWLILSLTINLTVLGLFKYYDFFVDSAAAILTGHDIGTASLHWILPIGISFYTFQTMSYTIDVYRGRIPPADNLLSFALYVAFFPQLVAGPIVRASQLLPQLTTLPRFSKRRFAGGLQQLLRGAFKKVVVADRLAETVDVVFANPHDFATVTIWIAVIGYAFQIYYDFSGYTDMAIGTAKTLGYRFPRNFRHPYLATSPQDFWRRWHITLSTWLRDYLYIPLGGSRCGPARRRFNLLATMTLGGLWHGAAGTLVLWGIGHGAMLSLWPRRLRGAAGWAVTMIAVGSLWVLFRSGSIPATGEVLAGLVGQGSGQTVWLPPLALLWIAAATVDHLTAKPGWVRRRRCGAGLWTTPVISTVMLWLLLLASPRGASPFIYFQF